MLGEPEMSQRQPEWDRQLESIDNQELEIHQSQLRLMRDQTAVFIGDLEALRKEVLALRSVRGDVQGLDTGLKELRDTVALEGAKREASRTRFEQRLCSELEQVLGVQLHTSLEADRDPLSPELVAQGSVIEPSHGSILARLGRIEADARGVAAEKSSRHHGDVHELREVLERERQARELQQNNLSELVQAIQSEHAGLFARCAGLERALAEVTETHSTELARRHARLEAQQAAGAERLEQLEGALRESCANQAVEFESLRASRARQEVDEARYAQEVEIVGASQQRRIEELERLLQSDLTLVRKVPERMDYLECMMQRTSDKHERILEKSREDLERLCMQFHAGEGTSRVSEKQLSAELQESWGSNVRKQGEDIEVLRSDHSALCQELKAVKASLGGKLSDAKAAMELCLVATKEQVQYLEGMLVSSAEKQAIEVAGLKDADARRSADFSTLRRTTFERLAELERAIASAASGCEELPALRARLGELAQAHDALAREPLALQAVCASLRARLESLEATCGEHAGRQEGDARAARDGLERLREELAHQHASALNFQGRLEACERDRGIIGELREKTDGFVDELASREAEVGCLAGRLDCVQRLVGSAAETSAKALETAHAGMEKLRTRIISIEGRRHGLDTLRNEFADDKAGFDTRLASLEGRVDSLGRRLGEAGSERAKELEASLNVRLASMEGRLDGLGRRVTEAGGERSRDLEAVLDSRVAQLELRIEEYGRSGGHSVGEDGHGDLEARVDFIEDMLVKSKEAHSVDMEVLRATLEAHTGELEALKEAHVYQASLADRLDGMDRAFDETCHRHDERLADARAQLEHICSRLEGREEPSTTLGEHHLRDASTSFDTTTLDSFCQSFQEHLARELEDLREADRQQDVRLGSLEASLRDVDARHADSLSAAHAQLQQLRGRAVAAEHQGSAVAELQRVLEEHSVAAAGETHLTERHARELDGLRAASCQHAARLDSLEASLHDADIRHTDGLSTAQAQLEQLRSRAAAVERHGTALAELQRAHSTLAHDKEDWEARHLERVAEVEERLGLMSERQERSFESVHSRIEKLGNRIGVCERQGGELRCTQSLHSDLKAQLESQFAVLKRRVDGLGDALGDTFERRTWEPDTTQATSSEAPPARQPTVEDRLRELETGLGDANARLARQLDTLRTQLRELQQRSSQDQQEREAWQESHHERTTADKTAHAAQLSLVDSRLKSFEDALSKSGETHARHAEGVLAHHNTISERFGPLEQKLAELSAFCEESVRDRANQAKLEESIVKQFSEEREVREKQLAFEQQARQAQEKLTEAMQRSFEQLKHDLAKDRSDDAVQRGRAEELERQVGQFEQKLTELLELCGQFSLERSKWAQLDSSVAQCFQEERKARDIQAGELQAELSLERRAREAHEHLMQEQLSQDRSARERFQDRLQDILAREGEVRERRLDSYEAALQHEAKAREACTNDLREMLQKEREAREQYQTKCTDLLREGEEASERNRAFGERVQALQRSVTICDSMMREEIQVRCKETKRLWEAIGIDGKPKAKPAEREDEEAPQDSEAEVTDTYVPFPCQPLTSFLRLGGQGLAEGERRRRMRMFSPGTPARSRSASPSMQRGR